ncbi:hypothetical protein ACHAXR_002225, partial [Thalassiosira sp. AJA248-18]
KSTSTIASSSISAIKHSHQLQQQQRQQQQQRKRSLGTGSTLPHHNSTLAVSEDESERIKRRSERNAREQERSHRITERIAELRNVLSEAGVHFKPDRYSTLVCVVDYIKMLQSRSASLDEEHQKLLDTISGADRLVNGSHGGGGLGSSSGGGAVLPSAPTSGGGNNIGMTTTVQTHRVMENTTANPNPSSSSSSSNLSISGNSHSNDEEFLVFVQGIDYKSIFSSCGVALAIASVDGRFVDCNEEFLKITEYTRRELLGDNVLRQSRNNTCMLPHPHADSGPPRLGGGAAAAAHPVVTVSTSTSANSTALTTAAAVAAAAAKTPDLHMSGGSSPNSLGKNRPPPEIHIQKHHHLSLFNLLGGEDMERVYSAMSRMLRAPEPQKNGPNGGCSSSRNNNLCSNMSSMGKDYSCGTSSSSSDSCVKSDLTRSTEESGSSGNENVSNNDGSSPGVMSGEGEGEVSRYTVDHWTGQVKHTRRKSHMLQLNISLVRTNDGRPKFFNCAVSRLSENEYDRSTDMTRI